MLFYSGGGVATPPLCQKALLDGGSEGVQNGINSTIVDWRWVSVVLLVGVRRVSTMVSMGDLSVLTGVLYTISLSFGHSKEKEIRCISVTYILIGGWCVCVCFFKGGVLPFGDGIFYCRAALL